VVNGKVEGAHQQIDSDLASMVQDAVKGVHTEMLLPGIIGNAITAGAEDNGILLPCSKTYNDWFCNDTGVVTGVKPRIPEGIANQRAVRESILDNLGYTHYDGAVQGQKLLYRSCNFVEMMVMTMYNIWSDS
jgi:hypothetical protein